jgi:prolyl-tRNA synthetase
MAVQKGQDFDEWYNEIVERADLCDKRYPVKGMNVWKPHGWEILQNIDALIRKEMKKTCHKEVYFPLLIPEKLFQKEADHIKGFDAQVFWVTHAGTNRLEERLLLRPTSETAMYSIFPLWIRSHADLPLKTFQIVNTFRYETKMTKAFLRVREIHFFEAHTCHQDFQDAENQIQEDQEIVSRLFTQLCLPYLLHKRPEWDKFAGAFYSIGIDVILPSRKVIQLGSLHQYKDNFSQPFDIKYEDEAGKHQFCHQTTYGMSERLLGSIIGIHGDDNGIVLPSTIAPIHIVIIPIVFKGKEKVVLEKCTQVAEMLQNQGFTVHVDNRDMTPGNKYYDWELKGVPVRYEIGPRDIEKSVITLARRDKHKSQVPEDTIIKVTKEEMESFDEQLLATAQEFLHANISRSETLDKVPDNIMEVPWCGKESCGLEMEEKTELKTLGTPIPPEPCAGACPICGQQATTWVRLANTY